MLARFAIVLLSATFTVTTAYANGNPILYNDVSWKSTQCAEPSPPAALPSNPETPADAMNAGVIAYENYTKAGNAYMNCLASEAMRDSKTGGQSVSDEAQAMINAEHNKIIATDEALHLTPAR